MSMEGGLVRRLTIFKSYFAKLTLSFGSFHDCTCISEMWKQSWMFSTVITYRWSYEMLGRCSTQR